MTVDVLGVVPARGGSTRVPRKNVRDVGGRPLIAHTLDHAADAELLDWTIVSTEDDEIASVARNHGGDVPFERPAELATDTATNNEVVSHALDWVETHAETSYDVVCLLSVTTPFRTAEDVDNCLRTLLERDAQSVVSVTEFETPPFWAVDADAEYLEPVFGEEYLWNTTRTQETETLHHPNASLYAAHVEAFREHESFYTDRTVGFEMPRERSLDIDEPYDLEIARALVEVR